MNTTILVGAEDVMRAGNTISAAAREMKEAAATIEQALYSHRQFMDDWLQRLETAIASSAERHESQPLHYILAKEDES